MIASIENMQMHLSNIIDYTTRMREFYSTGKSKEDIQNLIITKQELVSLFCNISQHLPPLITKKWIFMDWCIYQLWIES